MPELLGFPTWKAFYQSELQSVWAVVLVPACFLLWALWAGRLRGPGTEAEAAFVRRYALFFGVLTVLDPVCTGPFTRWLGLGEAAGTAVMLGFVLLGDFRVFLLLFGLRAGGAWRGPAARRAGLWTLAVPAFAWPVHQGLTIFDPALPSQTLWLVYEAAFMGLALTLRRGLSRDEAFAGRPVLRAYLRRVLAYVAVYYGLWALSDALVLGAGLDAGWALRVLPNQLYYALFVPFVYLSFFSARSAPRRSAAQAAR